jgi:hypothetical protein
MYRQKQMPPKSLLDAAHAPVVRAAVLIFCIVAVFFCTEARADATSPPPFEKVVVALTAHFESLPDFRRRDLLSQGQVAGALAAVGQAGWKVPNAKQITALALPDKSFLVAELATPDGKKFMRKIAQTPGAYSRLDRLSQISNGEQAVEQLIGYKDGDQMIIYMATTPGGHNLGQMMSGTPNGQDLNLPTGRIYTADDLLAALKKVYAKEFGGL